MKNTLLFLSMCAASLSYAQNSLPTTGNVGIGTTSPSSELEVKGNTTVETFIAKDSSVFEKPVIIKDSVKVESKMTVDQDVKIKGQTVFVDDAKARANFKVLGTTIMKGDAKVEGDFKFKSLEDLNTIDERFLMIKPNGKAVVMEKGSFLIDFYEGDPCKGGSSGNIIPTWSSLPNVIWTGDVCAPASVGIGTNSPDANLHVTGTGHFGGTIGIGTPNDNDNRLTIVQSNPQNNGIVVNSSSSSSSTFTGIGIQTIVNNPNRIALAVTDENTNNDVFRVMGNGNVLITSQDENETAIRVKSNFYNYDIFRLTGEGAIYSTSIHVRAVYNFPDYVFDEKYDLMPLDSLKQFIITNNHLPKVPSAKQVEEQGMDLGEMNKVLVEKVEELTLYILQLEERLKVLESQP